MWRSRSDLIENAEHFARIDLDLLDFEKERNRSMTQPASQPASHNNNKSTGNTTLF